MAIADTLKKVPTWGWLLVGGASLGVGYSLYRDRRNPALEGSAGEQSLEAGLDPSLDYYANQPAPIGVVSPPAPYDNTGQVGAIGQTAFETLVEAVTGVVETVPALIEAGRGDPVPINITLPQTPSPAQSPTPPRSGPPKQGPTSVSILGKRFVGAYRFAEVQTKVPGAREFNVFWHKPHKDERWRHGKSGNWSKITEGNFGG